MQSVQIDYPIASFLWSAYCVTPSVSQGGMAMLCPHLVYCQTVREELSSVKYDTLWLKRLFWVGVVAVLIPLFRDVLGFLP